jgi:hypothetical protein
MFAEATGLGASECFAAFDRMLNSSQALWRCCLCGAVCNAFLCPAIHCMMQSRWPPSVRLLAVLFVSYSCWIYLLLVGDAVGICHTRQLC